MKEYCLIASYSQHILLCFYRAVGANIVNRTDELKESDLGTGCGLFEIKKIGDEYV